MAVLTVFIGASAFSQTLLTDFDMTRNSSIQEGSHGFQVVIYGDYSSGSTCSDTWTGSQLNSSVLATLTEVSPDMAEVDVATETGRTYLRYIQVAEGDGSNPEIVDACEVMNAGGTGIELEEVYGGGLYKVVHVGQALFRIEEL